MRAMNLPKVVKGIVKATIPDKIEKATIHAVDGARVDLRIGTSPTVIRNVEVVGDASGLVPASEVNIVWKDGRPVVLSGAFGTSDGGEGGSSKLVPHGHTGENDGGILDNYLSFASHDTPDRHPLGLVVPHDVHSLLGGLGSDDHTQYVHKDVARTITAQHIFDAAGAPFVIGPNAVNQLVVGLYADWADKINRTINAGFGLTVTNGGVLTSDITLAVDASADPGATEKVLKTSLTGALTLQSLTLRGSLLPFAPDVSNIGSSSYPFLGAYISEMHGQRFVEETLQVAGGHWIIPKSSATLAAALDGVTTTVTVTAAQLWAAGDLLVMRDIGKVEYMKVTAGAGTSWTVARDRDGSGANSWTQGAVIANLGGTTEGYLEAQGGATPSFSVWKRNVTGDMGRDEIVRLGNLNGIGGINTNKYGLYIGDLTSYLKYVDGTLTIAGNGAGITSINGANITTGTVTASKISIDGFLAIGTSGGIYQGTYQVGHANDPAYPLTGLKLFNSSGIGKLVGYNAGNEQVKIDTDGKLYAGGGVVTLDAGGIKITTPDNIQAWQQNTSYQMYSQSYGLVGGIAGWAAAGFQGMTWSNNNLAEDVEMNIVASTDLMSYSKINLYCYRQGVSAAGIVISNDIAIGGPHIDLYGSAYFNSSISMVGGLNVGPVANASAGCVSSSSWINGNVVYDNWNRVYSALNPQPSCGYATSAGSAPGAYYAVSGGGSAIWNAGITVQSTTVNVTNYGCPTGCKAINVRVMSRWTTASNNNYAGCADTASVSGVYVKSVAANIDNNCNGIVRVISDQVIVTVAGATSATTLIHVFGYWK